MSQAQRAGQMKVEKAAKENVSASAGPDTAVGALERTTEEENEALKAELDIARMAARQAEAAAQEVNARLEAQVTREEEAVKRQLRSQRKVRIIIPSGRGDHERAPVPVAVNGREFLIVRDREVDVPEAVCSVLDLAVENVPVPVGEGGERRIVFQQRPAFPYTRLGYAEPQPGRDSAA